MPSVADRMKRKKRKVLIVPANDRLDKVEPKICVIAPMTTIPGDKDPARMAASPRISPPTTVTVEPTAEGNRIPASRNISKKRSAINISTATSKDSQPVNPQSGKQIIGQLILMIGKNGNKKCRKQ